MEILELTQEAQPRDGEGNPNDNAAGPSNDVPQTDQEVQQTEIPGTAENQQPPPQRTSPFQATHMRENEALTQRLVNEHLQREDFDEDGPVELMDRAIAWHENGRAGFDEHTLFLLIREALRRWQAANPGSEEVAEQIATYSAGHMGLRQRARETLHGS